MKDSGRPSTIKDVATIAGVSPGTVDRVLHNRGKVSEANKKKVLKAIEKLDYTPSQIGSALSTCKKQIKIGITYPQVDSSFWNEIGLGIEKAQQQLKSFGVRLIINVTYSYSLEDQLKAIDMLVAEGVDAILLTAVDDFAADSIEKNIPKNIPYATVINKTMGSRCLFHIGPDDFILGQLAAKLTSLYCNKSPHVLILSPNVYFTGSQQRIAGFYSKVNQELKHIKIRRVVPVEGHTDEEIKRNVYEAAMENIRTIENLTSIYVTDGFFTPAAAAIRDSGNIGKIIAIGHEYSIRLPGYLNEGSMGASIYQHPAQQWYQALKKLYAIIRSDDKTSDSTPKVQCSIIMKETLPFIKIADMDVD